MSQSSPLQSGLVLEKRYEIVRMLGQGGFGRAYLVKHLNRFNEYCVLKEFAPQVQGTQALQKAVELFQREAGVLYKLKHPQIPEFRELLQTRLYGEDYLFLVQQYIEGETYCELLERGKRFSEAEVIAILLDLLPVLEYIHQQGVIHRDISPDNLIRHSITGKPVLIDFGGVKQVAVTAAQQLSRRPAPTQLEKRGYTPEEQKQGRAYPSSDLYALAVTALVLLSAKNPVDLYNSKTRRWQWQQIVSVSPTLAGILDKMLADRELDRYPSAQAVRQVLQPLRHSASQSLQRDPGAIAQSTTPQFAVAQPINPSNNPAISQVRTWVVAPAYQPPAPKPTPVVHATPDVQPAPRPISHRRDPSKNLLWAWVLKPAYIVLVKPIFSLVLAPVLNLLKRLAIITTVVTLVVGAGYWFAPQLLSGLKRSKPAERTPRTEKTCQEILARQETLGIPAESFYPQVNEKLYAKYPELNGRTLTSRPEDARLRQEWCRLAEEVLDQTTRNRSSNSISQKLVDYGKNRIKSLKSL